MNDAIYILSSVTDDPNYSCLAFTDGRAVAHGAAALGDFSPPAVTRLDWQMPRLADVWRPRAVIDTLPGQTNDYPTIGLLVPAFSRRAADALHDLLVGHGELLPLVCPTGEFVAYNPTTVSDALDRAQSIVEWPKIYKVRKQEPIRAERVRHYEFDPARLAGLTIFRLREHPSWEFFVTQPFVDRVRAAGLLGFKFDKVWPLPRPRETGGLAEMERRGGL